MVRGTISGKEYSEKDIFDVTLYPRMKAEPLLSNDDCLMVPVRNRNAPHFRRIGKPSFGKRIGRSESNPTHNTCVQALLDELNNNKKIEFTTYVFAEDKSHEEQVILTSLYDSDYRWFKETEARVAFQDETYIQPDIAGRDINKFFPRSSYPNVVIEVIRTHHPDESTFQRLLELSKINHHVYFYFVAESKQTSKLNHLEAKNGNLTIRFSHYIIGGVLFRNGKEFPSQSESETYEHWYRYVETSYFKLAKEKA